MANIIHAGGGGGDLVSEAWVCGESSDAEGCLVNAEKYRVSSYTVSAPWSSSSGNGWVKFKLSEGYNSLHCLIAITCQSKNVNVNDFSGAQLTYKKIGPKVFECWFTDITANTFLVRFNFSAPAAVRAYMTLVFDD